MLTLIEKPESANEMWLYQLTKVLYTGNLISPRQQPTLEIIGERLVIDMRRPVVTHASRSLNYQFMAAEAYWILSGGGLVSGIAPWNKHISQFSDDGVTFAGAYGPRIFEQLTYVLNKLIEDPNTRQAGLTIWKPNPGPSKDIPCTIAIWFQLRDGRIHAHVTMRSSDVWLGLPYDLFNFSMLAHLVCCRLNMIKKQWAATPVIPGNLYLSMASSHLYEKNFDAAKKVVTDKFSQDLIHKLTEGNAPLKDQRLAPASLYLDENALYERLEQLRDTKPGDVLRWWEKEWL